MLAPAKRDGPATSAGPTLRFRFQGIGPIRGIFSAFPSRIDHSSLLLMTPHAPRRLRLSAALSLVSAFFLPLAALAADGAKPKILVDLGHGQTVFNAPAGQESARLAGYRAIATKLGAELATTKEPLTPATLKDVAVLAILMPVVAFDDATIAAVTDYVKSGGALLVVVDEEGRAVIKLAQMRTNELIAPLGLNFTGDTPEPHNVGVIAPPGPVNSVAREVPYSGGREVLGGTGYAFIVDAKGQPGPRAQAAFVTLPRGGKAIAMGEAMPVLFLGQPDGERLQGKTREDTRYWGKDAREFMADALAWLLKKGA
jgi:hypothetical protein